MAARAIWKGNLKFGDQDVPVKLYSAVEDRSIRFHLLEEKTKARITQKLIHPDTNEEVAREKTRKGYEIDRGVYVLLSEADLEQAQPPKSTDIDLTRFVPPSAIGPEWYERPYYLGPDARPGSREDIAYFAMAKALEEEKRLGIAQWVMRKKRYVGALRPQGGYLMLITLRFVEEVISAEELPKPSGRALDGKELKLAEQLVLALEGDFEPQEFRDEYRDRVMKLIESKARGADMKLPPVRQKEMTDSVADSLEASLKALKGKKGKAIA